MYRVIGLCLIFLLSVDGFVPKYPLTTVSPYCNVASTKFRPLPKTALDSEYQEVTPRLGFRNRVKSAWQSVIPQRNKAHVKAGLTKRRAVFGVAAFVVSMLARPVLTLAMGGMGGPKGPVAPMER